MDLKLALKKEKCNRKKNSNIELKFHGRGSPKERACILFTVRFEPGELTVNLSFVSDN